MTLREVMQAAISATLDDINESLEDLLRNAKDENYPRESIIDDIEKLLKLID